MRILGIQNFITNNINKVNQNSNNSVNNSSKNNLERSPMQDTVSFGKFGGKYASIADEYAFDKLLDGNINYYSILDKCIYLSIEPTKETINDLSKNTYEANLVSFQTFYPNDSQDIISQMDKLMRNRIEDFNKEKREQFKLSLENGSLKKEEFDKKMQQYKSGWEKHLTSTEDFERAGELADYLDDNGFFPRYSEGENDWMKRPFGLDYNL